MFVGVFFDELAVQFAPGFIGNVNAPYTEPFFAMVAARVFRDGFADCLLAQGDESCYGEHKWCEDEHDGARDHPQKFVGCVSHGWKCIDPSW